MALNPGTRLGPYEVVAQIGQGGGGVDADQKILVWVDRRGVEEAVAAPARA